MKSPQPLSVITKPYAADTHFGVREVIIFATKEKFAADVQKSVAVLSKWTADEDENVRRFVAEVLRPIGVWTKKIPTLQDNPAIGLPLIEPLKADPVKYVQNSVANWLNDASKSQPNWVKQVCAEWSASSDTKATTYIVKRALRTINKA
ncbi:MAG: DNA alkylation repair protein [Bacteroidota bacterium]